MTKERGVLYVEIQSFYGTQEEYEGKEIDGISKCNAVK